MLGMEASQEFGPYVFQLLAQMLDTRKEVSLPFQGVLSKILHPALYENYGNIPPVIRLLGVFCKKNPKLMVDQLNPVLGVFQKLIGMSKQDHFGFELIMYLIDNVPLDSGLGKYMPDVIKIILTRLSSKKTPKFVKGYLVFLSFFISKRGLTTVHQTMEGIQPGIFSMTIERAWIPDILTVYEDADRKAVLCAMAVMMFQSREILQNYIRLWPKLFEAAVQLMTAQGAVHKRVDATGALISDDVDEDPLESKALSGTFVKLTHSPNPPLDLYPTVTDAKDFFLKAMAQANTQHQGKIALLLGGIPAKSQEDLKKLLTQYKISI